MAYDTAVLVQLVVERLRARGRATLSSLARELKVSRRTLYAAVQSELHISYRELQRKHLINRAEGVLKERRPRSIKELTDLMGYESPRSFERFSLRTFGVTPTHLRSMLGGTALPAHRPGERMRVGNFKPTDKQ